MVDLILSPRKVLGSNKNRLIILPKVWVDSLDIKKGEFLECVINKGDLVISKRLGGENESNIK